MNSHPAIDITENWCIHQSSRKFLYRYYILYWDYKHYISQLTKSSLGQDVIIHQGSTYVVRMCEYSIKENPKRVALSFRLLNPNVFGYVLVKAV